jgi:hypothetical protein
MNPKTETMQYPDLLHHERHRGSLLVDHAAVPKGKGVYASSARRKNRKGISKRLCHNPPASLNKESRGVRTLKGSRRTHPPFLADFLRLPHGMSAFIGRPCGGGFLPCRFLEPGFSPPACACRPQSEKGGRKDKTDCSRNSAMQTHFLHVFRLLILIQKQPNTDRQRRGWGVFPWMLQTPGRFCGLFCHSVGVLRVTPSLKGVL